ncbi:MAG TPA: ATP-binding protein [bacterium]|nr:ATP-binding protein [bacterium]HPR87693.1 ATP-binding protein [bacterium]
MVIREITAHLLELASQYPVITLTGPRQSGKTTLVREVFKEKAYINLELLDQREFALADPRGFLRRVPNGAVLDEIQHVPELLSYIQGITDESKVNGLFILTGSQQFEILNEVSQSLTGRTAILRLLPFSYTEVQNSYGIASIDHLLCTGFFPRIYDQHLDPSQALQYYFETFIERDLRQLVEIRNLSQFQKFVRLCAGRVGQLLNLNSLGNDAGVSHTTAREWLSLLQASYIVFLLEPFHRNLSKRLIKSPKLYFYDTGLASYLLGVENVAQMDSHPLRGNLFENLVIAEILKFRFNQGKGTNLSFYRDSTGNETDVIYSIAQEILPIEIKSGETVAPDYFKGLRSLEKVIPSYPFGRIVVYNGSHEETRQDITITGVAGLLQILQKIT